jgi:hypothetical protein
MIPKTKWIETSNMNHPEIDDQSKPQKFLTVEFIDEATIEALSEKAHRMRCLKFFDEPYDPPDML